MEDETSPFVNGDIRSFCGGCNKDAVFFSGHILPVGREPPIFANRFVVAKLLSDCPQPARWTKNINHEKVVVAKPSNLQKRRIFLNFESSIVIHFFPPFSRFTRQKSSYTFAIFPQAGDNQMGVSSVVFITNKLNSKTWQDCGDSAQIPTLIQFHSWVWFVFRAGESATWHVKYW